MNFIKDLKNNRSGMVVTIALVGVTAVVLAITTTLSVLAMDELKMANNGGALEQTFYAAESGLNEALYRLISDPVPGTHTFYIDNILVEITVSTNPSNPYQRIIRSQATDPRGKIKTVQITANTNSYSGGFDYAIQGGSGGIFLDNNSEVIGDAYSNGDILPASGGARGSINGNAWAAEDHMIDKVDISGSAHAHSIFRSNITNNAYYQVVDIDTEVNGSSCIDNPNCFPDFPDPEPKPLPLNDADIQTWKDEITAIGNPVLGENPAECPPSRSSGFYCVTSNATLGHQKIDTNFYVGNGATLILAGNIWITGDILLDNNGTIQIDPSLGGGSVVIIGDSIIDVSPNYTISGSGDPRSFVLVISMSPNEDPGAPAIFASNNSTSVVFAALHGMLKVKQNGELNAAAAKVLYLENNSQVVYNPLLAAFSVPSGGSDEVGTALGTWQEL